jgi:hypothetical protein
MWQTLTNENIFSETRLAASMKATELKRTIYDYQSLWSFFISN